MADIATLEEFASFLQRDLDTATANLVLLDLAQGLIEDEIGARNPWPTTCKAIALAAAGRAYRNPSGAKRVQVGSVSSEYNAETMGVYLSDAEVDRLHRLDGETGGTDGLPLWYMPTPVEWPDPVWPAEEY